MKRIILLAAGVMALVACGGSVKTGKSANVKKTDLLSAEAFTKTIDSADVSLYTIENKGITVQICNYGARIVSLFVPDRNGVFEDVVLGYASIDDYLSPDAVRFVGPVVGPVANRIKGGKFTIADTPVQIVCNEDGKNVCHGGLVGLDNAVWDVVADNDTCILMKYTHPEGLDGWPSTMDIKVMYTATSAGALRINYTAVTDKPTPVNLSNHAMFNLTGHCDSTILDHVMRIEASRFTEVDEELIPTGHLVDVEGTPFDFRVATAVGRYINAENEDIRKSNGYDNNWCLDGNGFKCACEVYEPTSGRVMTVYTDCPGVQFYSGNFFTGESKDKYGRPMVYRGAFALETQNWPDAVNNSEFPNSILMPGEIYRTTSTYSFSVK